MKTIRLAPLVAFAVLFASACDKQSPDVAKQLAELERKANEATGRQRQLEQQIEDQKLAAEREAIERERMEIEEARAELERQQGETDAAEAERIRLREETLAAREDALDALQTDLFEKEDHLQQLDRQLSEREFEAAGHEALAFDDDSWEETPVGDYGMFYDSLSSYGSWFDTPDYGYVWQPVVVRDRTWRPYTRGRWVCSDHGWTWISDEPFGWATYHYGRWALVRGVGWVWAPGSEWAPSWVSWRSSGSHIGWAPLPPETLAYRRHHWNSSVDVTFGIGALWFSFVEIRHFGGPIHRHCLSASQNNLLIRQTINVTNIHVRNHRIISGGPKYAELSRKIGRPLPFYRLDVDRRGRPGRDSLGMQPRIDGDRLRVAAPSMDAPWNETLEPKRVKGRLESVTIERSAPISPEITDRFRRSRNENRTKAEQSVAELGGREKFNHHRMEQLEVNRRQVDLRARELDARRDVRRTRRQDKAPSKLDRRNEAVDRPSPPLRTRPEAAQRVPEASPERESRKRPDNGQPEETIVRIPQQPARETQRGEERNAQRESEQERQQQEMEEARREQAERQQQGIEEARRDQARREQQLEAQRQREQERQQQMEEARRKQEERQQQEIEETRREQARREQQLEAQRQREMERQQQMEEARREQAERQQQEIEEAQREQARREQQLEAQRQREQERQQQMEEARREQAERQQQEIEEARLDQARREQQREAERQREQAEEIRREQLRQKRSREQQQGGEENNR